MEDSTLFISSSTTDHESEAKAYDHFTGNLIIKALAKKRPTPLKEKKVKMVEWESDDDLFDRIVSWIEDVVEIMKAEEEDAEYEVE